PSLWTTRKNRSKAATYHGLRGTASEGVAQIAPKQNKADEKTVRSRRPTAIFIGLPPFSRSLYRVRKGHPCGANPFAEKNECCGCTSPAADAKQHHSSVNATLTEGFKYSKRI